MVETLARALVSAWGKGEVRVDQDAAAPHEAGMLMLDCSKARTLMGWHGVWNTETTVKRTVGWYRAHHEGVDPESLTLDQIREYQASAAEVGLPWAY